MIKKIPVATTEAGKPYVSDSLVIKLNEVIDYLNERVNPDQHIWKTKTRWQPNPQEGQDK